MKKAQQLKPKLYDGDVIKNNSAIVISDSEETLMLAEESHSKMILKQKDPVMLEKKVNTTPVDYAEKDLVITALKDDLKKLKGKYLVDDVVTSHSIAPEMLKVYMEPLAPKLLNNRTAHSDYLRHTQEQAAILKEVVEQGKSQNPLNNSLNHASSSSNLVSNKHALFSTGVRPSTSASGSQPSGNTKKDKIQRPPSSPQKNKHSKLNANPKLIYVKCNGCMIFDNHDLYVLNDVNARAKSKSVKKIQKEKFRNQQERITTTTEVPTRKPIALVTDTPKPVVTLVYSRKPKKSKSTDLVSKSKAIKSVSANKQEPSKSWESKVSNVPSSSLDECMCSKLFSGIWTLAAPSI
nr:hypothetical protein [Tanacetum cinerariifolium]